MDHITNQDNINTWSQVNDEEIEQFGDEGDEGRQLLLNPHLFRLLADVKDKIILDAGSGNGYLCRKLAKQGAIVTGVEPSESLLRYALQRERDEPLNISYIKEDLSNFHAPNSYDVIMSNMVFIDIPDYQTAIKNCIEALKAGGQFIFSLSHPCFENSSTEYTDNGYIKIEEYFKQYQKPMTHGYNFHRPLSTYLNLIIQNNCQITEVVEPQLSSDIKPNQKDHHIPSFIIIAAIKN